METILMIYGTLEYDGIVKHAIPLWKFDNLQEAKTEAERIAKLRRLNGSTVIGPYVGTYRNASRDYEAKFAKLKEEGRRL